MGQDIQEKELPEVVPSYVRALDASGNGGKAKVEDIGSLMGLDSYRYEITHNNIATIDVRPGIYIAYSDINPEIVVFCVGSPGRADWGIHVLLGSDSGAFSFSGGGHYINITLSEDGNTVKITNKYPASITVFIKRVVI